MEPPGSADARLDRGPLEHLVAGPHRRLQNDTLGQGSRQDRATSICVRDPTAPARPQISPGAAPALSATSTASGSSPTTFVRVSASFRGRIVAQSSPRPERQLALDNDRRDHLSATLPAVWLVAAVQPSPRVHLNGRRRGEHGSVSTFDDRFGRVLVTHPAWRSSPAQLSRTEFAG